jgi:hypothetical protein
MSSKKILLFLLLIATAQGYAQISGCTDPLSKNYNPLATQNDGSCNYTRKRVKPNFSVQLSSVLKETSSLLLWNSLLWTSNDDRDTTLYGMDTTGVIQKEIRLKKITNTEWEDMAQDSLHFYIGDFGNNVSGNRKDLHILRIEKESLTLDVPQIDTLSFSYSDQIDFRKLKPNTTNFDCEAFVVADDSIYLFTKQWKQKRTAVYALPKIPGNHVAQLKETYNIKGLITGATYVPQKKIIALSGYSKRLYPFIYLLYDYNNSNFFSGNKRKIKIALPFHQMEGIATLDGLHYYLTNEKFVRKPIINSPQQLHSFDLSAFLGPFLIQ